MEKEYMAAVNLAPPEPRKILVDCLDLGHNPETRDNPVQRPEPCYCRTANCFTVNNVLALKECRALIERAEAVGFEAALVNIGFGRQVYNPSYRNSDRCIIDDKMFAQVLFQRLQKHIPRHYRDPGEERPMMQVSGLNERMRILRYKPGHYFQPHLDGCYSRKGETSRCTVMIYLNGDYQGGHTRIYADGGGSDTTTITAEPGLVFVFDHDIEHESPVLESGIKYAIRTDLMFFREKRGKESKVRPSPSPRTTQH